MIRIFYSAACVVGFLLPFGAFLPWLSANGLSPMLLVSDAFGSPVSAFAWLDVIVSAVVLIAFISVESRRLKISASWIAIVATCTIGVSLGLPLFLLLRELALEKQKQTAEI